MACATPSAWRTGWGRFESELKGSDRHDQIERNEEEFATSEILAAAAHDMRQPLHGLNLLLSALAARAEDAETAALVKGVQVSADGVSGVIEALLAFSAMRAGGAANAEGFAIDELLGLGMGQPPGSCQLNAVCGGLYVVVEYNGDIYPCDFFVEDRWKLGNVNTSALPDMLRTETLHQFTQIKPNASNKCESCRFQGICHNGCPHYRSLGDGKFLELDYLCEAYYAFYAHAIPKMEKLLRSQQHVDRAAQLRTAH